MRHVRWLALFLPTVVGLGLLSAHASADPTPEECAAADQRSVKLRADHKLLDARAELSTCSAASCPGDLRDACAGRAKEVAGVIPTIVFEVKERAGKDLGKVAVTMDGQPLPTALDKIDGVEIEVDPGGHSFTFQAPGQPVLEKRLAVREGDKKREPVVLGATAKEAPRPGDGAGVLVQFYSPNDRWADGKWAVVDKEHSLVCPFPCLHAVPQHSGFAVRRIPTQYGHDDEFYPLPDTFDVPQGERGHIVVAKGRLWGTYGRYGSIFPMLLGLPLVIAGADILATQSTLVGGTDPIFTQGEAVGLGVGGIILGGLLIAGGVSWLILARDPSVTIVPDEAAKPPSTARGAAPPFAVAF